MLEVNRLYKARIARVPEWISAALRILCEASSFYVSIVSYKLFSVKKITANPSFYLLFHSMKAPSGGFCDLQCQML